MCVSVCSARVSQIAPSLTSLMFSPLAHAGAIELQAPQALLQSFYISDADIAQVLCCSCCTHWLAGWLAGYIKTETDSTCILAPHHSCFVQ